MRGEVIREGRSRPLAASSSGSLFGRIESAPYEFVTRAAAKRVAPCYAEVVSVQQRGASRVPAHARRRPAPRALIGFALTAIAATALGAVLYFATTSIAWFASAPTTDPRFGTINHCLMSYAPQGRTGFSVAHDGSSAATFNGGGVALCVKSSDRAEGRFVQLGGITALGFDGMRNLWIATGARASEKGALWRLSPRRDTPERVAHETPVALAGHATGAVVLDGAGRLLSISGEGDTRAFAEAPRVPEPKLVADAAGELIALVGGGALWIYRAADLRPVLSEAPCRVEYLWWQPQPGRALVACGPGANWALEIDAYTGAGDAAARRDRTRSVLVPGLRAFVVACEGLPCEAPPP
jgi:hypothetical protein